ncbi:hypothetical protein [Oscillibacter hominis]|uniref:hypothetical protein n=1 Tax=Oscillibacter hominis TaxID=2763056 RepID=UPI003850043B
MEFTVRAWCKSEDYWDVYFELTQRITEAIAANGVQTPVVRACVESVKKLELIRKVKIAVCPREMGRRQFYLKRYSFNA